MNNTDKTLILGTGPSILDTKEKLKNLFENNKHNVNTVAWGKSFDFYKKYLKYYPDYWWFLDAHSIVDSLKEIVYNKENINTELLMYDPVTTTSYQKQLEYIGGCTSHPDFKWSKDGYNKYLKLIDDSSKYLSIKTIKATSLSKEFGNFEKKNINIKKTIEQSIIDQKQTYILDIIYDKLGCCIIPLCFHFKFKDIYISGFDGHNGKFFNKKKRIKESKLKKSYKKYLPIFKEIFDKYEYKLYCLSDPKKSVVPQYILSSKISDLEK